ncbi:hypothetical protein GCM10017710_37780 [Arthrobacter ramosus]
MTPKDTRDIPISLLLFALVAVLLFIKAAGSMQLWWAILVGIALVGTGIGAFADFQRRKN